MALAAFETDPREPGMENLPTISARRPNVFTANHFWRSDKMTVRTPDAIHCLGHRSDRFAKPPRERDLFAGKGVERGNTSPP